jgi:hypothetical protein
LTPLHLIAVLLIVAGLAISAPPSCWCAPDDHFGLLLHPLFPHVHGVPHAALAEWDETQATDEADVRTVQQAPGISAGTADTRGHEVVTGLLLPLFLAAALLEASRRLLLHEPRPKQRMLAPPLPPPRIALTLA